MNIFDFNIHYTQLGAVANPHSESDETRMGPDDLATSHKALQADLISTITAANFMIFNQELFFGAGLAPFMDQVKIELPGSLFSALIDFRRPDAGNALDRAAYQGVRGLKFHSYFQQIAKEDFSAALSLAKRAQHLGMFVCVDTSFGTSGMYRFDNMRLACLLAEQLTCPIILLHSGGLRVLEAMLLAEEFPNIYLETSFSLDYYKGSTVEADILFAYRKLGAHRLIYGSDFPYISFRKSIANTLSSLEDNGFTDKEIFKVMFENASTLGV